MENTNKTRLFKFHRRVIPRFCTTPRVMPVTKSKPVPAFYDSEECTTILPVLSSQVEMTYQPVSRVRVSACEEMVITELNNNARVRAKTPRAKTPREQSRERTPAPMIPREQTPREKTPPPMSRLTRRARSVAIEIPRSDSGHSPPPASRTKRRARSVTIETPSNESEGSPAPSHLSSSSSPEPEPEQGKNRKIPKLSKETDGKIPKPSGEAARPGRGGYNVQDQLGWDKTSYERLRVSKSRYLNNGTVLTHRFTRRLSTKLWKNIWILPSVEPGRIPRHWTPCVN